MRRILLVAMLVLAAGCGSEVDVGATRNGTSESDPTAPLKPEELASTLLAYCHRFEGRIDRAAMRIEQAVPTNAIRRKTLRWRIRSSDYIGEALGRSNAAVSMVELWYVTVSMQAYYKGGSGKTDFLEAQPIAVEAVDSLRSGAEDIVRRVLTPERFAHMSTEITDAVGKGELFSAAQIDQTSILSEVLNVSHLQTLLDIPLSPFEALTGVSKGSDALHQLVEVSARGVDLAARYPKLLNWNIQLISLEIQEQDGVRAALADLHQLTTTAKDLETTSKQLPEHMREQATALLEQTTGVQATTQATLTKAQATADSLDHAARSLESLVKSVDTFIASFRAPPGSKPAENAPPARPFDIREYTAALQAASVTAHDIQNAVAALNAASNAGQLQARAQSLANVSDLSAARIQNHVRDLIDRIALDILELILIIAGLGAIILRLHHYWRGRPVK